MKELSIEEKAKRYDEALADAKHYYEELDSDTTKNVLEEIFHELKENKESDGESIRKALIKFHKGTIDIDGIKGDEIVSWLAKQGEHANFLSKIQVGDTITRNQDGVLVNLSQLKRVAKPEEKQGEPADKVEPKFKHGDRVRNKKSGLEQTLGSCIEDVYEGAFPFRIKDQDDWELVEQKPANKVEQKPIEWSKEDDDNYLAIANIIQLYEEEKSLNKGQTSKLCRWLQSLRPQKQWKPLGKHLVALAMAINDEPLDVSVRDDLNELFEQLKQL